MKRLRGGLSLFELLVVLALLGLALALLLPAVARVRQAASRAQSSNNLKQIGLACHNYHDANGMMPPGCDDNQFSAAARLLPYIEQDNLYKLLDMKKPALDDANKTVRSAMIKVFISPNDPVPMVKPEFGPTNYLFCAGSKYALDKNDGLFYLNSKVKFALVTDGLSNTLMAGETLKGDGMNKAQDVKRQHVKLAKDQLGALNNESGVKDFAEVKNISGDRCAAWIDGRHLQGTFTGTRLLNDAQPDVECDGMGGLSGLRALGNTTNILMGDGSVRAVTANIALPVWKSLASRDGGEVIPNF
jgi:prepilin-type processing-associated H-X9-DG protein